MSRDCSTCYMLIKKDCAAMNRSMSPTLIAEYKKKLIPQETVQKLLGEYCASFEMGAKQREKVSTKRKNK